MAQRRARYDGSRRASIRIGNQDYRTAVLQAWGGCVAARRGFWHFRLFTDLFGSTLICRSLMVVCHRLLLVRSQFRNVAEATLGSRGNL